MSTIKSYAIGNGDMYYVRHNSDNFTIIDCCLPSERAGSILAELATQSKNKGIKRFISTHPDQDHLSGLVELDDTLPISNFYCVENRATKFTETEDFKRYKSLRDGSHAFYIYKGCSRKWMNHGDEDRGSSGINVLWPSTSDPDFITALDDAGRGLPPNNISPIIRYALSGGPTMIWMGDLETDFMEKIEAKVNIRQTDVLFAPHHGRTSGKVPQAWLDQMDPGLVVIGEAPSEYLDYYSGYKVITQNSCGDILFDATPGKLRIYVGDSTYNGDFLNDEGLDRKEGLYYIGTLYV